MEGDVQHWWLPPLGQGVRTRISDDRLWLPYVTAQYIEVAGDRGILDEVLPFLDGPVRSARYEICVENPNGVSHGVSHISLGGKTLQTGDAQIPLADDGANHTVQVVPG